MLSVATIFGTRPEAIKLAPVIRLTARQPWIHHTVIVTAQHREMLDQVLELFEIRPDLDLALMTPGQSLEELTARVVTHVGEALREIKPDLILVQGDTTTTFGAALAAFYQKIAIGHVEAGLRTFDKYAPWPEEMNRQLTSRLVDVHFAPTQTNRRHLLREGIADEAIEVTGNTVIDALHWVSEKIDRGRETGELTVDTVFEAGGGGAECSKALKELLESVHRNEKKLILVTAHRRENFGAGFKRICESIRRLAKRYPECGFVYPVHLNPVVQAAVKQHLTGHANVYLVPPLDYLPFVYLMKFSTLVLTDSGGIQEEAPGLGKPVLVMRDITERPEAVEAGTVELVGTSIEAIVSGVSRLLDDEDHYTAMARAVSPYGDGKASERIVARLKRMSRP